MPKNYITIQEAADLSRKSVQTIRRAIKAKKLKARKEKTPQGFNYKVEKASLAELYGIMVGAEKISNVKPAPQKEETKSEEKSVKKAEPKESKKEESSKDDEPTISKEDLLGFTQTVERLMNQHSEERQNFLRLITTLQEKIFVLENQINLLTAPKKKWYQLWK